MGDLISIIVPVYNTEKYLEKCIESIIRQTYSHLEIILVDDGSTDGSAKICDEYAQKERRIRVIHKENGGLSDARNTGIKHATGSLIGFVDSDDYIAPHMYQILYENLKKYQADIAICGIQEVDEKGQFLNSFHKPDEKENRVLNTEEALYLLIEGKDIQTNAYDKLYKAELFTNIQYPQGKNVEDLATTYRLLDKANCIVKTNQIVYYYVQRKNSIIHSINCDLLIDWIDVGIQRYYDLWGRSDILNDILIIDRLCYISNSFKLFYQFQMTDEKLVKKLEKEYTFYQQYYKAYRKSLKIYIKRNVRTIKAGRLQFELGLLNKSKKIFQIYSCLLYILKKKGLNQNERTH